MKNFFTKLFPDKNYKILSKLIAFCLIIILAMSLSSCSILEESETSVEQKQKNKEGYDTAFMHGGRNTVFSIVSGSENEILEPLLEEFAKKEKINLGMDYLGSLGIMHLLEQDRIDYDAVWPASSLWVSVGDNKHRVKNLSSITITPVVFGVKDSLAAELGFKDSEVFVKDILDAIEQGKLKFTMTSATQSNSGASAYMGFLYALLDNPSAISLEDLENEKLQKQITSLLSGVERSSGSSNWLCDLYLQGDYDAMVNYEALLISTNQNLEKEGREPLYAIYPEDGLTIADSPLGFVADNGVEDRDQDKQEKIFLKLQEYLLSPEVQAKLVELGRRSVLSSVSADKPQIFRKEWGIDTKRIISTKNMPTRDIMLSALNLYQSNFKKPGYNIFLLDFSGSMLGKGHDQLIQALEQILIQENASANLLQASSQEINSFYSFSYESEKIGEAKGPGKDLEALYSDIKALSPFGGTAIYKSLTEVLEEIKKVDLRAYNPAIILMTDGERTGDIDWEDLEKAYAKVGVDVPIFSILFGSAQETELKPLAEMSKARIFDGRENLIEAFRKVRGYN